MGSPLTIGDQDITGTEEGGETMLQDLVDAINARREALRG